MRTTEDILSLFPVRKIAGARRDHIIVDCLYCGKKEHMYVRIKKHNDKEIGLHDCKSCQEGGNFYRILSMLGKLTLFSSKETVLKSIIQPLSTDEDNVLSESDLYAREQRIPVGFKRLTQLDDYLKNRNFIEEDLLRNMIGTNNLLYKLKNYLTFIVYEDGKSKGYVSRVRMNKNDIKKYENETGRKILRYINSVTDFNKLLYGYDDLLKETKTVIAVEGIFDQISLMRNLNLYDNKETKGVATFGSKISEVQMHKLKNKGIRNFILIYDSDSINKMKKESFKLKKYFKNVLIGLSSSDKDIGDSNQTEITNILDNLHTPESFNINTINLLK